jgi:hypothetical protein
MNITLKSWLMAGALVLSVTSCATFTPAPVVPVDVDLSGMPAQSIEAQTAFGDAVFAQGPGAVNAICDQLVPLGTGDDTNARFALSGLAKHASRPGARGDQHVFAESVLLSLHEQSDTEVKSFLIRQLQFAGKNESVAPLSAYLADDELCSAAAQALQAIGTRKATYALHAAALSASSTTQRVTLLKALAEIEHHPAQPLFEKYAVDGDRDVRFAGLLGLAKLGIASSEDTLKAATQTGSDYDKIEATALYGLYTRNSSSH